MEYTVEDLSPTKKKVAISVDPKEVEASIMATVALYRTSVKIDGFRPGKVPASVVEARFRQKIYEEAKQDLVNVHINEVMQKLEVTPLSGIEFDGGEIERDKPYTYAITFEVLPAFELPPYEGLEVEQEKAVVDDAEVDAVIDRILKERAVLVPAEGQGPAVDGQVVELDFSAWDEDGNPVKDIKTQNFQLPLGENQALEDFENLVRATKLGEENEGKVTFPGDFLAPDLAGKTVTMKVKVHAIKNRQIPALSDELAKTMGQQSAEKLRQAIVDTYTKNRADLNRAAAEKSLLDKLLKMVDFPLPDALVDTHVRNLLTDRKLRLERQGKSLEALGKSMDALTSELRPEAESIARGQAFLMAVARKEKLEVTEQEVDGAIYQIAQRSGDDFKQLKQAYASSQAIFTLRDRLLADKAMDAIYAKAHITEVEPREKAAQG